MSFDVAAESYDRFMGRYSVPLAPLLASFAGVSDGQRALDVGSGPGALTTELVRRLGTAVVVAVDPSSSFVDAVRARLPGIQAERASAEHLPFPDHSFDVTLAQLVVHFMADPIAGLAEMARVTRPGGIVAACVWDHAGGQGPLGKFWEATRELEPRVNDESKLPGAREGHLEQLLEAAGLRDVEGSALSVTVEHQTFEEWWKPFTLGVGPAGSYTAGLAADRQAKLRELCRLRLRDEPFRVTARAWAARGRS
jgi:ubiquinone/menaquinone biosynthesis C-methylase UbiE